MTSGEKKWITAVLVVKPEYAEKIKFGSSIIIRVEFTTSDLKHLDRIIFYETSPVMMCTCEARVIRIARGKPNKVWEKYKNISCNTKEEFDEYVGSNEEVTAVCYTDIIVYDTPKPIKEFGLTTKETLKAYAKRTQGV